MNKIIAYTLSFVVFATGANTNEQHHIIADNVDTRIVQSSSLMTKTKTDARDEQFGDCIRKGKCKD